MKKTLSDLVVYVLWAISSFLLVVLLFFPTKIDSAIITLITTTADEIEPNIFLVNLRGEPKWNEEMKEITKTAFRTIPQNLKSLVTREKPLRIGITDREFLKKQMRGYNSRLNVILIDIESYGYEEKDFLGRRDFFYYMVFHEFGHGVDNYLGWISQKEWANLVKNHPASRTQLPYLHGDPLKESFASTFLEYMMIGSIWHDWEFAPHPDMIAWFEKMVFSREEPKRELLALDLLERTDLLQMFAEQYFSDSESVKKIGMESGFDYPHTKPKEFSVPWIVDLQNSKLFWYSDDLYPYYSDGWRVPLYTKTDLEPVWYFAAEKTGLTVGVEVQRINYKIDPFGLSSGLGGYTTKAWGTKIVVKFVPRGIKAINNHTTVLGDLLVDFVDVSLISDSNNDKPRVPDLR